MLRASPLCLSASAPPRTQATRPLGSVVAEAPSANGCLSPSAVCFLCVFVFGGC